MSVNPMFLYQAIKIEMSNVAMEIEFNKKSAHNIMLYSSPSDRDQISFDMRVNVIKFDMYKGLADALCTSIKRGEYAAKEYLRLTRDRAGIFVERTAAMHLKALDIVEKFFNDYLEMHHDDAWDGSSDE